MIDGRTVNYEDLSVEQLATMLSERDADPGNVEISRRIRAVSEENERLSKKIERLEKQEKILIKAMKEAMTLQRKSYLSDKDRIHGAWKILHAAELSINQVDDE